MGLKDSLILHAQDVYQGAKMDLESLVVITGCIKSHSWAMASYLERATAPADQILRLERLPARADAPDAPASFDWTDQAMAEARCGSNTQTPTATVSHRHKDQSLFLRGFRMSFSTEFRARMKSAGSGSPPGTDCSGDSDSSAGSTSRGNPGDEHDKSDHGSGPSRTSQPKTTAGHGPVDGVDVNPLPGRVESVSASFCFLHCALTILAASPMRYPQPVSTTAGPMHLMQ